MRLSIFQTLGSAFAPVGVATTISRCWDDEAHASPAAPVGTQHSPAVPGVTSDRSNRLAKEGRRECGGQGTTSWVHALRPRITCCGRTA
jgi:hypothetical protein